jgi:hypothetical protein
MLEPAAIICPQCGILCVKCDALAHKEVDHQRTPFEMPPEDSTFLQGTSSGSNGSEDSFPSLAQLPERRRSFSNDTSFLADETEFLLPSASSLETIEPLPSPIQPRSGVSSVENSLSSSTESSQEHRLVKIRAQSPTWCHICTSMIWLTQPALNCKKCNLWIHKKCQPKVVSDCGQDMARIGFMKRVAGEHRVRVDEVHRMFKVVHKKVTQTSPSRTPVPFALDYVVLVCCLDPLFLLFLSEISNPR